MEELKILAEKSEDFHDEESGNDVKLRYLLGGDMKYFLLIYGLSNATSSFPCLYCKSHKEDFCKGIVVLAGFEDYDY